MENDDEKGDRDRLHHHPLLLIVAVTLLVVGSASFPSDKLIMTRVCMFFGKVLVLCSMKKEGRSKLRR